MSSPIQTPGFREWVRKNEVIQVFRTMTERSEVYARLSKSVDSDLLRQFLASDRSRKIAGSDPGIKECGRKLRQLVEKGGFVAGGCALHQRLGTRSSGDVDVFFRGFDAWAQATLETRGFPHIDVCWFEQEPWETFDLTATCLAFGKDGEISSPECEKALETKVCEIRLDWIFHPVATCGRIVKYGQRWGFKFPSRQVAQLVVLHGVPEDVAKKAFEFCV